MPRRPLLVALALAALALAVVLGARALRRAEPTATAAAPAPVPAPSPAAEPLPPAAEATPAPAPPDAPPPAAPGDAALAFEGDPVEEAWSNVDLEAVRAALPDNLYWQSMAPTEDPRVLREREEAKARWNEQYGKVLSGTGSEEEIREFFQQRQRTSADAIQFVDYLLEHHAGDLTERDQQLLQLARRLHLARLEEIPRKLEEAFARKRAQDEARAAWLADEARFRGEAADGDEGDGSAADADEAGAPADEGAGAEAGVPGFADEAAGDAR